MDNGSAALEAAPETIKRGPGRPKTAAPEPVKAERRITMKLERNCRLTGDFDIVGHMQPELKRKNPAGVMETVRPETFVKGEPAPPPIPGVGTFGKLWAGTIVAVPEALARDLRRAGIASLELADD